MFSISILFPISVGFVSVADLLEFGCVCSLTVWLCVRSLRVLVLLLVF